MIYYKDHSQGFTLIELLVVIAIVGILASVVLASLNSAREKSRNTSYAAQLKQYQSALDMYFADNGTYPIISGYACLGIGYEEGVCVFGGNYSESSSPSTTFRTIMAPYIDATARAGPQAGTYKGALYQQQNSGRNYMLIYLLEGVNLTCIIGGQPGGSEYTDAGYTRCNYTHPL